MGNTTKKEDKQVRNYDVSKTNHDRYGSNSEYISCDPYSAKNNNKFQCTKDEIQYDLVGCKTNYHTENNRNCVSDYDEVNCNTY